MYRGWTQTDYQNKHYNINQKDEGTQDDRGRDGGTNFILRTKEQETRLTLQEHDDDDDDDDGGDDVDDDEVRLVQPRLGQDRLGYVMLGQDRQVRLGYVTLCWVSLG